MDKKEKISAFEKEISIIKDSNVKKLLKACLTEADDWFFLEPASSSGKYHPDFAKGVGGLVLHTRAVVFFLIEILRSELFNIDDYHKDLLILSAIIHDIKKYGEKNNTGHTVKNHPELAASFIEKVNKNNKNILKKNDIKYIQDCVIRHMGIFGNKMPETDDEKLIHIADLLASRKEIDLKFSVEEKKKLLPKMEEYVIDFGMHRGKHINETPTDYLKWAVNNVKEKKVFVSLAKEFLKENTK